LWPEAAARKRTKAFSNSAAREAAIRKDEGKDSGAGQRREEARGESRTHFPRSVQRNWSASEGSAKGDGRSGNAKSGPEASGDGNQALRSVAEGSGSGQVQEEARGHKPNPLSKDCPAGPERKRRKCERDDAEAAMRKAKTRTARQRTSGSSEPGTRTRDSGGWWRHQPPLRVGAPCFPLEPHQRDAAC
jgi:hypothetical protein